MPRTVAEIRVLESATQAYAIFVEGLPYVWVTDHDGDALLGSGASSWIGRYEDAVAWETVGQRTVLPGLVVPDGLSRGMLNRKSGMFESTSADITIVDHDAVLADLFATEGQDEYTLGERVAPDQTALDATLTVFPVEGGVVGPGTTIDAAGYNIGLERLGPARERRYFFHLPVQGIGLHHQHNPGSQDEYKGPPPIPVTASPQVFAGRHAALYRIYRDDTLGESYLAWPTWDDQHAGGGLVWMGVMRDQGEYAGDRTWKLSFYGAESMLRRDLGTLDTAEWMTVSNVEVALADHERDIAIAFYRWDDDNGNIDVYPSRAFGTVTLPATGTSADYVTAVADAVRDLADGTVAGDFNDGFTDPFFDHDIDGSAAFPQNRVSVAAEHIGIRRPPNTGLASNVAGMTAMTLCLHEKVWRLMGWEPQIQKTDFPDPSVLTEVGARKLNGGDLFLVMADVINDGIVSPGGGTAPADNYWNLYFNTKGADGSLSNSGAMRFYEPLHAGGASSEIAIMVSSGDQDFGVAAQFPYVEGDPTVDREGYDAARYFLFRGKRTVGDVTDSGELVNGDGQSVDELESEDEFQIARVQWDLQGTSYGTVDDSSGTTTFHVRAWNTPRRFGVDRPRFLGEWAFEPGGDFGVECRPLSSFSYYEATAGLDIERSWGMLLSLLLSTGSTTPLTNGAFTAGLNDPGFDIFSSEMGLGIHNEIVASAASVTAAFESVPGGQNGALNQVRYVYAGPVSSWDILADIVQARGLAMSLDGGEFGVVALKMPDPGDVSISLNEDDIYAPIDRPDQTAPVQTLKATGALDRTILQTRWDPSQDKVLEDVAIRARDPGARWRRGDFEETLPAHGLMHRDWSFSVVDDWESDANQLWSLERPRFLAKRHFLVKTKISRIQGQDLWPGTRVRLTNRKVINPAGANGTGADADGYGVTNALGIVLRADLASAQDASYDVEILIFADQHAGQIRLMAPIAKIANPWTGSATVPVESDAFAHEDSVDDALRFLEPDWPNIGGALMVGVLEWDRTTWTLHDLGGTVSVSSAVAGTVTLSGSAGTFHEWTHKWLVPLSWDDQADGEWPRELFLPIVLAGHTFGSGPTTGWPLLDA
jgi:hypothetical protein